PFVGFDEHEGVLVAEARLGRRAEASVDSAPAAGIQEDAVAVLPAQGPVHHGLLDPQRLRQLGEALGLLRGDAHDDPMTAPTTAEARVAERTHGTWHLHRGASVPHGAFPPVRIP